MTQRNQPRTQKSRRGGRYAAVQRAQRRRRMLAFLGGVVAVAVIAVVALIVLNQDDAGEVVAAPPLEASIPTDGRVMGDPNAPVTVVEWGDYQ